MKRRYSRVHKILENAGVIYSESDDSDIIQNTPVLSPENCFKQVAASNHLKCDSNLTKKYAGNEASDDNTIGTTMTHKQVCEVGEISIEAPAFSPLTPKLMYHTEETPNGIESHLRIIHKDAFEVGEASIVAPTNLQLSPKQASQLVLAGKGTENFSSLPPENFYVTENRTDNEHDSPLSSPVPYMSPETSKIMNILIGTEPDSDDSAVDPNYETDSNNSTTDNDSYAHENSHIRKFNRSTIKNTSSNSPSILPEISGNFTVENEDMPILVSSNNFEESSVNLKKRKNRDPSTWKINIEKRKRLRGEMYMTKKGKVMKARPLKPAKCLVLPNHKCISLVPQEERLKIYTEFRNLSSLQEQRHFVVNHVTKKTKKRETTQSRSRRNFTLIYSLTVAKENKVVCREFFLDTLNITGAFVKGALKKINSQGLLLPENRGKKAPPNKLMPSEEQIIHDHIQSFPAVESHYCRRDSTVTYLDPSLNITIMHKEYQKLCAAKTIKAVSFEKYRSIFKTYKLSFHKPKKDLCKQCLAFNEMNNDEKSKHQDTQTLHLARKTEARQCRDEDKDIAKSNDRILSFNFDLEAVLNTPKGAAGPFFYVRKLAVYNLTVYNLGNQDVECYMWDETEGKRGSVEISTCIHTYIMAHHNINHVRMMSDGCGGQQKNYHFSSMCLLTLQEHASLQVIDHKFFESGHTHMECDSIHSKIEKKAKNIPVYTPDGWTQIVRLARTNPRPFSVTSLQHDDFKDFGMTNQFHSIPSNSQQKYGINNAVWLQYRKEVPDTIFMKTSFDKNESFIEMILKKRRGKVISYPVPAYSERLKISSKKQQDLMKLCTDLQIPKMYHSFYTNLPYSKTTRDALPEPDAAEVSE